MIDNKAAPMERLGVAFGVALMLMLAFTVAAPYMFSVRSPELIRQIDQTQGTIQNLCLILASFLFGTSVGRRQQENTIDTLAKTAQVAQAQVLPKDPEITQLDPGQVVQAPTSDEIKP